MEKVIIIGASGHAAEIQDYITAFNQAANQEKIQISGFLDDDPHAYEGYLFRAPYLGDIKNHRVDKGHLYVLGIANYQYRRMIVELFLNKGARFITLIHPSAYVSESAEIGEGCILGPNTNVGPNVRIGAFTLMNSRSSCGHDTVVGKYNFISPNVCFSGGTMIGDENLFGINCATKPGIQIGDKNKIEAGMVLDKNIADNTIVFFRYKEKVIAVPKS